MPRSRRPVEDFTAVLRGISRQGKDPVILVGGQAVNVWAMAYRDRLGPLLRPHLPLTSKDMDVYATRSALLALHREVGGRLELSGPREITEGTLILGDPPDTLEVDALRILNGVSNVTRRDGVDLEVCGHVVPVLFPHVLLQGKLANALELEQRERQDAKHVRVLCLVLREFLDDTVTSATPADERPALSLLVEALEIIKSDLAGRFARLYGHSFQDVMPSAALAATSLRRLRAFRTHQLARAKIR